MKLVYPPNISYSVLKQRPQFIMSELAKELGFECIFYDSHPPYQGAYKSAEPYSPEKGITVVPPNYPVEEIGDFALYLSNPFHYDWIEKYKPEMILMDNLDYPVGNQTIEQLKYCCKNADVVLNVSKPLMKLSEPYAKKNLYIPNGVELNLYKNTSRGLPKRIKRRIDGYGKVIGYAGVFWEEVTDWPLFVKIAKSFPDDIFLCSGTFFKDYGEKPENMEFVGHLKREYLPSFISSFDVAVIPFLENKFTNAMCPLKTFEYLACGRTILSTPIPEVEKLTHRNIARHEDFIPKLDYLLKCPVSKKEINEREKEAEKYDWSIVLEPLVEWLETNV